jgi:hypothetical protein
MRSAQAVPQERTGFRHELLGAAEANKFLVLAQQFRKPRFGREAIREQASTRGKDLEDAQIEVAVKTRVECDVRTRVEVGRNLQACVSPTHREILTLHLLQ